MKRAISLIISAVLLLSLVGCSSTEEKIYKKYQAMQTKLSEATSVDTDVKMDIKLYTEDENIDIKTSGNMKQLIHSEDSIDMIMNMAVESSAFEGTQDLAIYYVDGVMYQEMMGMKLAINMDLETANESMGQSNLPTINLDAIKNAASEKVDGGTKISVDIDGSLMQEALSKQIESAMSMLGSLDGVEIKFGDVTYSAVIGKNNLPISEHMVYTVEMTADGEKIKADYDTDIQYKSINSFTSLDLPNDLDTYELIG